MQNIKAVTFSFSPAESNFISKANEIRTLPFSLTHVSQMNSLRRPPWFEVASFLWLKKLGSYSASKQIILLSHLPLIVED